MSLPREYRIRELYLKFFEENFPRDRVAELLDSMADCEAKLIKRLSRINRLRDKTPNEAIFSAYLYSLFDAYSSGRHRISSLKELVRFKHHFTYDPGAHYPRNQLIINQTLRHCKVFELLNREEVHRLALSISLFQSFLNSVPKATLSSLSARLGEFVLHKVNAILDDETYDQRVRLYGQLVQTATKDIASSLETTRLALQCMPVGEQKSSNIFLYIIVKLYRLWPEVPPRLLHIPVDADLSRVVARIGLTRRRLSNLEYSSISYMAIQTLAKRLLPENPAALYGLKYVAKVWCKPRSPNCVECPMNGVCDYAQAVLL